MPFSKEHDALPFPSVPPSYFALDQINNKLGLFHPQDHTERHVDKDPCSNRSEGL